MEQTVLYLRITLGKLFLCERNLRKVILTLVRVVGCRVKTCLLFLCLLLSGCYGVTLLLGVLWFLSIITIEVTNVRLIDTLPVIHIVALTPCADEGLFTLLHGERVIEIPCSLPFSCSTVVLLGSTVVLPCLSCIVFFLCGSHLLLCLLVALFLLLLLEGGDNAVDSSVTVFLTHLGKELERVLKFYGIGKWRELIKNLTALRKLLIVVAVLVEESDSLAIATSGITVFLLCPIKVAKMQKQHTLLNTRACSLLVAGLVCVDCLCGIFQGEVDITDGIIHLIKIFLVVLVGCHVLQAGYHLSSLSTVGKNLRHGYSGIELHLVRRMLAYHLLECLVCLVLMSESSLYLSKKVVFTCTLL